MKIAARNFNLIALFLLLSTCAAAPTTKPAPEQPTHTFGSGDTSWISLPISDADGDNATLVFTRNGSGQWQPLAQVGGIISQFTEYRSDLVALMQDSAGSWRTIFHDGSILGAAPDGKLLAVAGDRDNLYGLVRRSGAVYLELLDTAVAATHPAFADNPATVPSTRPATLPIFTTPAWRTLDELPKGAFRPVSSVDPLVAIAIVGRRPVIASVLSDNRVAMLAYEDKWTDLGTITPNEIITELKVFPLGRRIGVWLSPGTSSSGSVFVQPFPNGLVIPLGKINGEAYVVSERIRLLYTDPKNQKDMEKSWDFSGRLISDYAFDLPTGGEYPDVVNYAVGAIMLLTVIAIFRRRAQMRDMMITALQLPLASRTRRAVAGLIDLAPMLLTAGYVAAQSNTNNVLLLLADRIVERDMLIATVVCVLHPLITEMIAARSIGKMLFGLRVISIDGSPAKPAQLFIRNMLRIIDFFLGFLPLLLVFITPLRQRVGDAAAGTIVVDDNKSRHLDEIA